MYSSLDVFSGGLQTKAQWSARKAMVSQEREGRNVRAHRGEGPGGGGGVLGQRARSFPCVDEWGKGWKVRAERGGRREGVCALICVCVCVGGGGGGGGRWGPAAGVKSRGGRPQGGPKKNK